MPNRHMAAVRIVVLLLDNEAYTSTFFIHQKAIFKQSTWQLKCHSMWLHLSHSKLLTSMTQQL